MSKSSLIKRKRSSTLSTDSMISHDSNFPTEMDCSPVTPALNSPLSISSLLTKSDGGQDKDDEFFMSDLDSLDEGDDDKSSEKLGALLSRPVQTDCLSNSSDKENLTSEEKENSSDSLSKFPTILINNKRRCTPEGSRLNSKKRDTLLASHVNVSPLNPQARPPMRRALSLFNTTPPPATPPSSLVSLVE